MDKEKYDKLSKFQGRFANLWGPTDIIFCGNKLIKIWPDCWNPFGGACDLKYIDENTLQIDTNNSYGNIDEKMKFEFKDGKVKAIYRSGELIMPIDEWKKKRKSMSIVALSK